MNSDTFLSLSAVLILTAVSTFYTVEVLLWDKKTSKHGPYPSKTREVVEVLSVLKDGVSTYNAPVTLFDWIRRGAGMYNVVKYVDLDNVKREFWYVKRERAEVWECPTCLSFWVALFFSGVYSLMLGYPIGMFLATLPGSGLSLLLWWKLNKLKYLPDPDDYYGVVVGGFDDDGDEEEEGTK